MLVNGEDRRIGGIGIHGNLAFGVLVAVRPLDKVIVFVRFGLQCHFRSGIVSTRTGNLAVFGVNGQRVTALGVTEGHILKDGTFCILTLGIA